MADTQLAPGIVTNPTIDDILVDYPHLTRQQIREAITFQFSRR